MTVFPEDPDASSQGSRSAICAFVILPGRLRTNPLSGDRRPGPREGSGGTAYRATLAPEHAGEYREFLALAFLVGTLLTALVRSSSVVSVFSIGLAGIGVLSVDQANMAIYGSVTESAVSIWLLSTGHSGRSRQVAMYLVLYTIQICAVLVPMFLPELYSGILLVKALVFAVDL